MEPLSVDQVYFYPKENATRHNTDKYELLQTEDPKTVIVRRGQPFNGVIRFQKGRDFDENVDVVQLLFSLGPNPAKDTTGSMVVQRVPDKKNLDLYTWNATWSHVVNGQDLMIEVTSPVNVPVGNWSLKVMTKLKKSSNTPKVYEYKNDTYILFNPWNPKDQSYMADSNLLREYVLSDVGKVWVGTHNTARGKPWKFGQFSSVVLPAVMYILDKAETSYKLRGDPVRLSREISRIVNTNDDGGVVVGRWGDNYEGGKPPMYWNNSVDILAQYYNTKKPVKYGQCWVFACVLNTVCRALGLPSRVVTNYVSAHDSDQSLTIDRYFNEKMEEVEGDSNDSVWNFHVWNDVWMARPDLPKGFDGWQAVDATPQERSDRYYQCGPAPVRAIKEGVTGVGYDVEFLVASVNADIWRWKEDPRSETGYIVAGTETFGTGRMILTKAPSVFDPETEQDREDITEQYKYPEYSTEERTALMNSLSVNEKAKKYYAMASQKKQDLKIKLRDIETVTIGATFRVVLEIENTSNERHNVLSGLFVFSTHHNGKVAELVKKRKDAFSISAKEVATLDVLVEEKDYINLLVDDNHMKSFAHVYVDETMQLSVAEDYFQIMKPQVEIQVKDILQVQKRSTVVLSLMNPLSRPLTSCEFTLSAQDMERGPHQASVNNIPPNGMARVEIKVEPIRPGKMFFIANFNSKELAHVSGYLQATVADNMTYNRSMDSNPMGFPMCNAGNC